MPMYGSGVREIIGFQQYFQKDGLAISVYENGKIRDGSPLFFYGRQYLEDR